MEKAMIWRSMPYFIGFLLILAGLKSLQRQDRACKPASAQLNASYTPTSKGLREQVLHTNLSEVQHAGAYKNLHSLDHGLLERFTALCTASRTAPHKGYTLTFCNRSQLPLYLLWQQLLI